MKSAVGILLLLLGFVPLFAQSDSAMVVNAPWQTRKIAPGIRLKHCWFRDSSLFGVNQNITILEVKQKRRLEFDLGAEPVVLKKTSEIARENGALAAINGTFFDIANGGSVDYIRWNGAMINRNRDGNGRALHQKAAVVIRSGRLSIAQWDGSDNWEEQLAGEDVMLSGPLLLLDSKAAVLDSVSFNVSRHPRSAIAVLPGKKILLITVDGRHPDSAGMSLFELSAVLRWIGCTDGINLDGGGSTTLWIGGEPESGIVNYPSDNKQWDHEGERKVANVVLVKKK